MYIYILKLEKGKYYIGKSNKLNKRLTDHFTLYGSGWTKKYKPVKVIETINNCIQVIKLAGKKAFVRLTEVSPTDIRSCLDSGCDGLIFSTVETVEQCEAIKNCCYFPPKGKRQQKLFLLRLSASCILCIDYYSFHHLQDKKILCFYPISVDIL